MFRSPLGGKDGQNSPSLSIVAFKGCVHACFLIVEIEKAETDTGIIHIAAAAAAAATTVLAKHDCIIFTSVL